MLVIRLQRTGRQNNPSFRVVVTQKDAAVKGKCLEVLGHYLPSRDPVVFEYNQERVTHWMKRGAQPSNTLARLLTKQGVGGLEKFIKPYAKKEKKIAKKKSEATPAEGISEVEKPG